MPRFAPKRGDAVWLDFSPKRGHEQAGRRPALVVSATAYNRKVGLAVVCPITNQGKGFRFEVALPTGHRVSGSFSLTTSKVWTGKRETPYSFARSRTSFLRKCWKRSASSLVWITRKRTKARSSGPSPPQKLLQFDPPVARHGGRKVLLAAAE
jgi:hypothetical protein